LKARQQAPNAREESGWKSSLSELGASLLQALPGDEPPAQDPPAPEAPGPITVGDRVLVRGLGKQGEVVSLASRGRKALVRIGATVTSVGTDELTRLEKTAAPRPRPRTRIETVSPAFSPTLDLRGVRYEDALEKIRVFVDQAALSGCREVTVIHGKGTGALQQAAREALQEHPLVQEFHYSPLAAGGSGSTVVVLGGS
jgi:DNA mismatch repair protein MutS2